MSFAEDNPRIPQDMIYRVDTREQTECEGEDPGEDGIDNTGDGMEAGNGVGEEDPTEVEKQKDSVNGHNFGENNHMSRASTQVKDESGTESDLDEESVLDEESDMEEISGDEESEERNRKLLEEAVATHAAQLYSKIVINKGKKYADKFKDNLKDIAREQILETLEKRRKERLEQQ